MASVSSPFLHEKPRARLYRDSVLTRSPGLGRHTDRVTWFGWIEDRANKGFFAAVAVAMRFKNSAKAPVQLA